MVDDPEEENPTSETEDEEHSEQHQEEDTEKEDEEEHEEDEDHEEEEGDDSSHDYKFSLVNKTEFSWHDGREPKYDENWEYHIKDTINPLTALYKCPNESVDYSGVEFKDRKSYIISPTFKSWKKVECNFTFWCSAYTSDKYKATNNDPQLTIEEYDSNNKLIGTEEVFVKRSDVPSDNNPLKRRVYLRNIEMTYFIIRRTNYIPNGNSSYGMVLSEANLRGWDYE